MRNADSFSDVAGIVDVLSGAAGALTMSGRAMIVKLQRDADDVIALGLQQGSRHRRVDAAGHGDNDPDVLWTAFEVQTVEHDSGHRCDRERLKRLRSEIKALSLEGLGAASGRHLALSERLKSCSLI
jgi:hypothetical protein